jgi:fermentation-respiration switch protein FrsA (DUF1100 family)
LVGNLHLPENFDETKKYKAVVVTGSWTTVKEQMPDLYAAKLRKKDSSHSPSISETYGESEGQPRNYENPEMKAQDIKNSVDFLKTLSFVDGENVGGLAVCASTVI